MADDNTVAISSAIGRAERIAELLRRARRFTSAAGRQADVDQAFAETVELNAEIIESARSLGLRSPLHG